MTSRPRVFPPSSDMYQILIEPSGYIIGLLCKICGESIPVRPTTDGITYLNQLEAALYGHVESKAKEKGETDVQDSCLDE